MLKPSSIRANASRAADREKFNASRRARYAKDSTRMLADNKRYREKKADELKVRRRVRVYGTDGEAMFKRQRGKCAICKHEMFRGSRHIRAAHMDHDHATGLVRGWLCSKCNTGLGHFNDNPALIEKAAMYLRLHG